MRVGLVECALALACLLASPGPVVAQRNARPIVEADAMMFVLSLGMDTAEVRLRLGAPDSARTWEGSGPKNRSNWRYGGVSLLFDLNGLREGAALIDSSVATPRGLRVGQPIERLLELYGNPTVEEPTGGWRYESSTNSRLVMRVLMEHDRITWIYIGLLDEPPH